MARDFSQEAWGNAILRGVRSTGIRTRGRALAHLGFFAPGSSSRIGFSAGVKLMNSKAISFADHVSFGKAARIECHSNPEDGQMGQIQFGSRTSFGDFFHAGAIRKIVIGNNVLGGSHILLVDHNHGSPKQDMLSQTDVCPRDRRLHSPGPIIVEDDVWIADQVVILGGVSIGKGAIIAAQSVVRRDVPPYSIYANGRIVQFADH